MTNYTVDQLYGKLERADAAGDTEAAQAIASEIRRVQAAPKADFSGVTAKVDHAQRSAPGNNSDFARLITGNKKPNGFYTAAGGLGMTDAAAMVDSFQHHLLNIPAGIDQGLQNVGNWIAQKAAPESEFAKRSARNTRQTNQTYARREDAYQDRNPDVAGAYAGAAVGEVLPWMVGVGELRAAGLLPNLPRLSQVQGAGAKAANLAAKTGLLAAEGATMGALQPVTNGDYGSTKAAQVGVGAAAAPLLAGTTAGAGKLMSLSNYLTQAGRGRIADSRLAKLYGTDPQTLAQLRQQAPIPGFTPTPAQALRTPEAIQAERILRNNLETAPAFARVEAANNAAMRGVGADIAQESNPRALAQAQAARRTATQPYYDSLVGQPVPASGILTELDALANSNLGVAPKVRSAIVGLRNEIESRSQNGNIDASILSGIRENVRGFLGDMPSAKEKKALEPIADKIAGEIDAAIPGYRANLAAYADASRPISDIRAGRELLDAIDSGGRDTLGNPTVDLAKIRAAIKRDDKAKFKMSPQARQSLESLLEAAQQRSVTNNTIAASGPGTAADALRGGILSPMWQRIATQAGGGVGVLGGGTMGGPVGGFLGYLAGTGIASGANAANNAVLRQVGQRGSSAPAAAEAIESYLRRQQQGALPYLPANALLPYTAQ